MEVKFQSHSLACFPSKLSAGDWYNQLISRILHILYGQWIFKIHPYMMPLTDIGASTNEDPLLEIDRLSQMLLEDIPNSSKYLLEIAFHLLATIPPNNKVIGLLSRWRTM